MSEKSVWENFGDESHSVTGSDTSPSPDGRYCREDTSCSVYSAAMSWNTGDDLVSYVKVW